MPLQTEAFHIRRFMRMRPVLGPILIRPGVTVDSLPE